MLLSIIRRIKNKNSDEDFNVDEGVNVASLELYSLFFNQRTTTPQFTPKIELTTLYTFDIG
jgi:hypothetical protein